MRQVQWSKLNPAQISNTIWKPLAEKGKDGEERTRREKIDVKELETLFCAVAPAAQATQKKNADVDEKATAKKAIILLNSKTSNNLSIMLGRVKVAFPELKTAIMEMNEDILNENMIKQFLQFIPTDEDATLIRDFVKNDEAKVSDLARAEQFFWEMLKIPRYEQRLLCINYKMKFVERISEIRPDITIVHETAAMLKDNKKIAKLLEVVLAIGNYLNGDSFRGQAYGFSIDLLSKLGDVKGAGSKVTLLHYLASLIDKKFNELKDFTANFVALEKATRISLVTIGQEISDLDKGMKDLVKELDLSVKAGDTVFSCALENFINENAPILEDLKLQRDEMETCFKHCVEYFGDDSKTATPETFFGVFNAFISNYEKARKDNEKEMEAQRKAEERAQKLAEKERLKAEAEASKGQETSSHDDLMQTERKGVMDDLITSLKSGDAFKGKSKSRATAKHRDKSSPQFKTSDGALDAEKLLAELNT